METRRALDSEWALRDTHACKPLENAYAHVSDARTKWRNAGEFGTPILLRAERSRARMKNRKSHETCRRIHAEKLLVNVVITENTVVVV